MLYVKELSTKCKFNDFNLTVADRKVTDCYCGDLLSRALSGTLNNKAWLTVMNNENVIAVAVATQAACVILTEGILPDEKMLAQAKAHAVNLFGTELDTYHAAVSICGYLEKNI